MAVISEFMELCRDMGRLLGAVTGGASPAALRGSLYGAAERTVLAPFIITRAGVPYAARGFYTAVGTAAAADSREKSISELTADAPRYTAPMTAQGYAASGFAGIENAAYHTHRDDRNYRNYPDHRVYDGEAPRLYRAAITDTLYAKRDPIFPAPTVTAAAGEGMAAAITSSARVFAGNSIAEDARGLTAVGRLNSMGILPRLDGRARTLHEYRELREGYVVKPLTAREITRLTGSAEHSSQLRQLARTESALAARPDVRVDLSGMRNILNDKHDIDELIDKLTQTISEAAYTAAEGVHL